MVEVINRHHRGEDRYVGVELRDGYAIIDTRPGDGDPPKVVRDQLTARDAIKLVRQYNDNAENN